MKTYLISEVMEMLRKQEEGFTAYKEVMSDRVDQLEKELHKQGLQNDIYSDFILDEVDTETFAKFVSFVKLSTATGAAKGILSYLLENRSINE